MDNARNTSTLQVKGVDVELSGTQVIKNVSVEAQSGELLAILGPSGSGKTTLLNVIAGRHAVNSGEILLNGEQFTKRMRRKLGFVLQHDIFFSGLTLWETLYFAAMIRMPESVKKTDKLLRLDEVIEALNLRNCLNTVFGDTFTKGLSGGERKRANIACELLTDPDILLLDEPTTGLDSSAAFALMKYLKTYAANSNKIVIATIHQPSSRTYQQFDRILLLANGMVVYMGPGHAQPLYELEKMGIVCEKLYSPADFLLEVLKSDKRILDGIIKERQSERSERSIMESNLDVTFSHKFQKISLWSTQENGTSSSIPGVYIVEMKKSKEFDEFTPSSSDVNRQNGHLTEIYGDSWPTSSFFQFRLLFQRCFKQEVRRLSKPTNIILPVAISIVLCLVFFQLPDTPSNVRDKMGLINCSLIVWFGRFQDHILTSVQQEQGVIYKERSTRWYRASMYYLAKSVSSLPVMGSAATLCYTAIYWISGLGDINGFFTILMFFWFTILLAESTGTLVAICITDSRKARTVVHGFLVTSMLLGGFFNTSMPWWFQWLSYVTGASNMIKASMIVLLSNMGDTPCEQVNVDTFPQCMSNTTGVVTQNQFLEAISITLPVYAYILIQIGLIVILQVVGYVCVRTKHAVPLQ